MAKYKNTHKLEGTRTHKHLNLLTDEAYIEENMNSEYFKNETLTFTINNKKIKAVHKGTKLFKDQKNGLNELKAFIRDEIVFQNKSKGFIPYNNFESSVHWEIKGEN